MLLSQYLAITQSLIQTPQSPIPLLTPALLTTYINIARGQVAGQGECVLAQGTMSIGPGTQNPSLPFSFTLIEWLEPTLIAGAINIRMLTWATDTGGAQRLYPREWPWFNTYVLSHPVPKTGPPKIWAQYRQGSLGTLYVNPLDGNYVLRVDAVCYPVDLVDDTTPDGIPYLWSDAVPFYAAYYAYMAMQRQADADHMLQRFQELMGRARTAVTPAVQPGSYPQGPDPMMPNRLALQPAPQRGRGMPAGAMAG
jgi:hypothetical protein